MVVKQEQLLKLYRIICVQKIHFQKYNSGF